jgi:hypothetical protein
MITTLSPLENEVLTAESFKVYCTEMGVVGSAPIVKKLGTQLKASTASLKNKLIFPRVRSSVYDIKKGLTIS